LTETLCYELLRVQKSLSAHDAEGVHCMGLSSCAETVCYD
jgi:hypothetical protein